MRAFLTQQQAICWQSSVLKAAGWHCMIRWLTQAILSSGHALIVSLCALCCENCLRGTNTICGGDFLFSRYSSISNEWIQTLNQWDLENSKPLTPSQGADGISPLLDNPRRISQTKEVLVRPRRSQESRLYLLLILCVFFPDVPTASTYQHITQTITLSAIF